MDKITIIGAGTWGTALGMLLVDNGHQVTLWSAFPEELESMEKTKTHRSLPGIVLPEEFIYQPDLEKAMEGAKVLVLAVPSIYTRGTARKMAKFYRPEQIIVNVAKGIEEHTLKVLNVQVEEEIPGANVCVLSGPSHAEEVARRDITTITAACENLESAKVVQTLFSNSFFRVYTNTDCVGVEMGAALKNVIAVGAGALHGLGYGDNAKAALMTRGLSEISRLGIAFGADPLTFIGLSGVGDLIVTCTSMENMGMVVEGVETCKAVYALAQEKNIEMPITTAVYNVLYKGHDVREEIQRLMGREFKSEASIKEHQ